EPAILGQKRRAWPGAVSLPISEGLTDTRSPRGREDTHPGRSSTKRNVVTPTRSGDGRPSVSEAESLSGEEMSQEAKASSRKATGDRLDRATAHAERRPTWDRARGPTTVTNADEW